MALMPPDELVGFLNFLGLDWPTANEDELFRVAELYVLIAEDYRALQEALTEVSGRVGEEFEGAAAQAFLKLVGKLDNGEAPALEAGASQSLQLSEVAHATGVDVEHSKLAAIMELVSMFVEFLVSAAFTYFLGPAFAAMLSMRFLATRSVILALLRRVVFAIAAQSAIGAGVETALELLVQAIQIDKGHRDTIDWDLVGQSAAAGAIGGAIAAPLDAAGMAFAKWLGNQIGSGVKQTLGKSLRDVFTGPLPADVGKAAASRPGKTAASHAAAPDAKSATGPLGLPHQDAERFADDLGGVLTDVHAHFSKGLYKDGVPDDVTQTFAKNVAKVFDKHLSPVLPDGAAGRLGHDWAKTLSTGWGNDAASRDLVKDRLGELARAAGLDRQAAHTLARDVPDSLAKVLDTPPGGWRHSALEFTTGTLMDGVTNVLTEGTVAAVFEGEFSVDGGSFLAGAAMGGLARGTLALGGAAYDGAGQALSWFRGGDDAGPAATSLDPMKPGGDLKPDPPVTDPGQLNVTGPVVGEPALPGTGTGQGTGTTVGTATVGQAPAPPATQSTSTSTSTSAGAPRPVSTTSGGQQTGGDAKAGRGQSNVPTTGGPSAGGTGQPGQQSAPPPTTGSTESIHPAPTGSAAAGTDPSPASGTAPGIPPTVGDAVGGDSPSAGGATADHATPASGTGPTDQPTADGAAGGDPSPVGGTDTKADSTTTGGPSAPGATDTGGPSTADGTGADSTASTTNTASTTGTYTSVPVPGAVPTTGGAAPGTGTPVGSAATSGTPSSTAGAGRGGPGGRQPAGTATATGNTADSPQAQTPEDPAMPSAPQRVATQQQSSPVPGTSATDADAAVPHATPTRTTSTTEGQSAPGETQTATHGAPAPDDGTAPHDGPAQHDEPGASASTDESASHTTEETTGPPPADDPAQGPPGPLLPPLHGIRDYGTDSHLVRPSRRDQWELERVFPKERDGSYRRYPDPRGSTFGQTGATRWFNRLRTGNLLGPTFGSAEWVQRLNGPWLNSAGRTANCVDAARSFLASWYGRPTVAAPVRTRSDGPLVRPEPESVSLSRTERWLGAQWRSHAPGTESHGPGTAGRDEPGAVWDALGGELTAHGHGSAAIVVFRRPDGGSHAVNAVNHHGTVYWIDAQHGRVAARPDFDGTAFLSIVLGPDGKPLPTVPPGGPHTGTATVGPPVPRPTTSSLPTDSTPPSSSGTPLVPAPERLLADLGTTTGSGGRGWGLRPFWKRTDSSQAAENHEMQAIQPERTANEQRQPADASTDDTHQGFAASVKKGLLGKWWSRTGGETGASGSAATASGPAPAAPPAVNAAALNARVQRMVDRLPNAHTAQTATGTAAHDGPENQQEAAGGPATTNDGGPQDRPLTAEEQHAWVEYLVGLPASDETETAGHRLKQHVLDEWRTRNGTPQDEEPGLGVPGPGVPCPSTLPPRTPAPVTTVGTQGELRQAAYDFLHRLQRQTVLAQDDAAAGAATDTGGGHVTLPLDLLETDRPSWVRPVEEAPPFVADDHVMEDGVRLPRSVLPLQGPAVHLRSASDVARRLVDGLHPAPADRDALLQRLVTELEKRPASVLSTSHEPAGTGEPGGGSAHNGSPVTGDGGLLLPYTTADGQTRFLQVTGHNFGDYTRYAPAGKLVVDETTRWVDDDSSGHAHSTTYNVAPSVNAVPGSGLTALGGVEGGVSRTTADSTVHHDKLQTTKAVRGKSGAHLYVNDMYYEGRALSLSRDGQLVGDGEPTRLVAHGGFRYTVPDDMTRLPDEYAQAARGLPDSIDLAKNDLPEVVTVDRVHPPAGLLAWMITTAGQHTGGAPLSAKALDEIVTSLSPATLRTRFPAAARQDQHTSLNLAERIGHFTYRVVPVREGTTRLNTVAAEIRQTTAGVRSTDFGRDTSTGLSAGVKGGPVEDNPLMRVGGWLGIKLSSTVRTSTSVTVEDQRQYGLSDKGVQGLYRVPFRLEVSYTPPEQLMPGARSRAHTDTVAPTWQGDGEAVLRVPLVEARLRSTTPLDPNLLVAQQEIHQQDGTRSETANNGQQPPGFREPDRPQAFTLSPPRLDITHSPRLESRFRTNTDQGGNDGSANRWSDPLLPVHEQILRALRETPETRRLVELPWGRGHRFRRGVRELAYHSLPSRFRPRRPMLMVSGKRLVAVLNSWQIQNRLHLRGLDQHIPRLLAAEREELLSEAQRRERGESGTGTAAASPWVQALVLRNSSWLRTTEAVVRVRLSDVGDVQYVGLQKDLQNRNNAASASGWSRSRTVDNEVSASGHLEASFKFANARAGLSIDGQYAAHSGRNTSTGQKAGSEHAIVPAVRSHEYAWDAQLEVSVEYRTEFVMWRRLRALTRIGTNPQWHEAVLGDETNAIAVPVRLTALHPDSTMPVRSRPAPLMTGPAADVTENSSDAGVREHTPDTDIQPDADQAGPSTENNDDVRTAGDDIAAADDNTGTADDAGQDDAPQGGTGEPALTWKGVRHVTVYNDHGPRLVQAAGELIERLGIGTLTSRGLRQTGSEESLTVEGFFPHGQNQHLDAMAEGGKEFRIVLHDVRDHEVVVRYKATVHGLHAVEVYDAGVTTERTASESQTVSGSRSGGSSRGVGAGVTAMGTRFSGAPGAVTSVGSGALRTGAEWYSGTEHASSLSVASTVKEYNGAPKVRVAARITYTVEVERESHLLQWGSPTVDATFELVDGHEMLLDLVDARRLGLVDDLFTMLKPNPEHGWQPMALWHSEGGPGPASFTSVQGSVDATTAMRTVIRGLEEELSSSQVAALERGIRQSLEPDAVRGHYLQLTHGGVLLESVGLPGAVTLELVPMSRRFLGQRVLDVEDERNITVTTEDKTLSGSRVRSGASGGAVVNAGGNGSDGSTGSEVNAGAPAAAATHTAGGSGRQSSAVADTKLPTLAANGLHGEFAVTHRIRLTYHRPGARPLRFTSGDIEGLTELHPWTLVQPHAQQGETPPSASGGSRRTDADVRAGDDAPTATGGGSTQPQTDPTGTGTNPPQPGAGTPQPGAGVQHDDGPAQAARRERLTKALLHETSVVLDIAQPDRVTDGLIRRLDEYLSRAGRTAQADDNGQGGEQQGRARRTTEADDNAPVPSAGNTRLTRPDTDVGLRLRRQFGFRFLRDLMRQALAGDTHGGGYEPPPLHSQQRTLDLTVQPRVWAKPTDFRIVHVVNNFKTEDHLRDTRSGQQGAATSRGAAGNAGAQGRQGMGTTSGMLPQGGGVLGGGSSDSAQLGSKSDTVADRNTKPHEERRFLVEVPLDWHLDATSRRRGITSAVHHVNPMRLLPRGQAPDPGTPAARGHAYILVTERVLKDSGLLDDLAGTPRYEATMRAFDEVKAAEERVAKVLDAYEAANRRTGEVLRELHAFSADEPSETPPRQRYQALLERLVGAAMHRSELYGEYQELDGHLAAVKRRASWRLDVLTGRRRDDTPEPEVPERPETPPKRLPYERWNGDGSRSEPLAEDTYEPLPPPPGLDGVTAGDLLWQPTNRDHRARVNNYRQDVLDQALSLVRHRLENELAELRRDGGNPELLSLRELELDYVTRHLDGEHTRDPQDPTRLARPDVISQEQYTADRSAHRTESVTVEPERVTIRTGTGTGARQTVYRIEPPGEHGATLPDALARSRQADSTGTAGQTEDSQAVRDGLADALGTYLARLSPREQVDVLTPSTNTPGHFSREDAEWLAGRLGDELTDEWRNELMHMGSLNSNVPTPFAVRTELMRRQLTRQADEEHPSPHLVPALFAERYGVRVRIVRQTQDGGYTSDVHVPAEFTGTAEAAVLYRDGRVHALVREHAPDVTETDGGGPPHHSKDRDNPPDGSQGPGEKERPAQGPPGTGPAPSAPAPVSATQDTGPAPGTDKKRTQRQSVEDWVDSVLNPVVRIDSLVTVTHAPAGDAGVNAQGGGNESSDAGDRGGDTTGTTGGGRGGGHSGGEGGDDGRNGDGDEGRRGHDGDGGGNRSAHGGTVPAPDAETVAAAADALGVTARGGSPQLLARLFPRDLTALVVERDWLRRNGLSHRGAGPSGPVWPGEQWRDHMRRTLDDLGLHTAGDWAALDRLVAEGSPLLDRDTHGGEGGLGSTVWARASRFAGAFGTSLIELGRHREEGGPTHLVERLHRLVAGQDLPHGAGPGSLGVTALGELRGRLEHESARSLLERYPWAGNVLRSLSQEELRRELNQQLPQLSDDVLGAVVAQWAQTQRERDADPYTDHEPQAAQPPSYPHDLLEAARQVPPGYPHGTSPETDEPWQRPAPRPTGPPPHYREEPGGSDSEDEDTHGTDSTGQPGTDSPAARPAELLDHWSLWPGHLAGDETLALAAFHAAYDIAEESRPRAEDVLRASAAALGLTDPADRAWLYRMVADPAVAGPGDLTRQDWPARSRWLAPGQFFWVLHHVIGVSGVSVAELRELPFDEQLTRLDSVRAEMEWSQPGEQFASLQQALPAERHGWDGAVRSIRHWWNTFLGNYSSGLAPEVRPQSDLWLTLSRTEDPFGELARTAEDLGLSIGQSAYAAALGQAAGWDPGSWFLLRALRNDVQNALADQQPAQTYVQELREHLDGLGLRLEQRLFSNLVSSRLDITELEDFVQHLTAHGEDASRILLGPQRELAARLDTWWAERFGVSVPELHQLRSEPWFDTAQLRLLSVGLDLPAPAPLLPLAREWQTVPWGLMVLMEPFSPQEVGEFFADQSIHEAVRRAAGQLLSQLDVHLMPDDPVHQEALRRVTQTVVAVDDPAVWNEVAARESEPLRRPMDLPALAAALQLPDHTALLAVERRWGGAPQGLLRLARETDERTVREAVLTGGVNTMVHHWAVAEFARLPGTALDPDSDAYWDALDRVGTVLVLDGPDAARAEAARLVQGNPPAGEGSGTDRPPGQAPPGPDDS